MGRAPCCDKANVKKGPWSPEEDTKLKEFIENHGTGGNWIALPHKAGLKRCGKSCRLRWLNYLRPNIKHGEFSAEEDRIICTLFANIGSRWSIIAAQLPGRTDNDIKNYWNTKLKKKLLGFTSSKRKPIQHQQQQQEQFLQPSFEISTGNSTLPSSSCQNNYYTAAAAAAAAAAAKQEYQMKSSGNFLMFGGETSCSTSSDGSCSQISYDYNNIGVLHEQIAYEHCFYDHKFMLGMGGEVPIDYGYEEIKELLGGNNNNTVTGCNDNIYAATGTTRVGSFKVQEKFMYYH
ncbi:hypothetical protein J5N97_024219 [Dioscorea zingiberensis]|uniref:Uncharacterized protein n=1 Tax=Dioscorea zingiberensis TaxID=325984 RepID=A0A9D5C7B5_9LILI|nr:hypothetical protein J5N97_024219 [Dioscorea zingiberensis]